MKKLLVTGHAGFVGQAMRAFLNAQAHEITWLEPGPGFDILDPDSVRSVVELAKPDWIIHLAAQSHVPTSWAAPARTLAVNAGGTANLLKALADIRYPGRFLFVSSADVYGAVPVAELPVMESREPAPRNPYASSKVAAEVLCCQWARTHDLDVVIARPFNHTGAGQRPDFALPSFAREIAAIRQGRQPPQILTGDLAVTRDFLDVQDVVRAYLALLGEGRRGEIYNVCSGTELLLADALRQMLDICGVQAEVLLDPARLRPSEQPRMRGTYAKLEAATGWRPEISTHAMLAALVDHWIHTDKT